MICWFGKTLGLLTGLWVFRGCRGAHRLGLGLVREERKERKHSAGDDTHFALRRGSPLHPSAEPVCCAEQNGPCSLRCRATRPVPSPASNAGGRCAGLVFRELLVPLSSSGAYAVEAIPIPARLRKSIDQMQCSHSCAHAGALSFSAGPEPSLLALPRPAPHCMSGT